MGCPVSADQGVYVLFIGLPLLVVWVISVVDVVRQPHMSRRIKWIWVISFSLIWPLLVVYLLNVVLSEPLRAAVRGMMG